MIAYINGTIKHKSEYLIVEVNSLGYKVFVPANILLQSEVGANLELFTHQHVREDSLDLFGFKDYPTLRFFEQLISVSGIGPKIGLAILAQFEIGQVKKSIVNNDPSLLTKVSGIGKKTAERLILELKEKVDVLAGGDYQSPAVDEEAAEALVSLGLSKQEAAKALTGLAPDLSVEDKIKQALKNIGKRR